MFIQVGKLSKKPVDPLDKSSEYHYSKSEKKNQYEILLKLEDEDKKYAFINDAYAAENSNYGAQRLE
jgi:hypothetical protein